MKAIMRNLMSGFTVMLQHLMMLMMITMIMIMISVRRNLLSESVLVMYRTLLC